MSKYILALLLILMLCHLQCRKKEGGRVAGNDPPEITNITLLPLNPTVKSEITARILSEDKNGDPITYQVKWFVNDREIGEGMSLSYEDVKKGDKIFADITPYDGKEYGKTKRSDVITIGDSPPRIVSLSIIPDVVFVTTPQVTLNALFEDPDQDSMNLIVHWLVNDEMQADTASILQLGRLKLKKNDLITGAAFVDDGEFRSEPFTFEIPITNSPPAFRTKIDSVRCRADSVYYLLPIYDPDGDRMQFEILQAPAGINIDPEQGIIFGSAGEAQVFEVAVRVTDIDGAYLDAQFTLSTK